jgi:flavin reductase (DIM6/NTAB) family NADH-FMN oxidoreductase RutF
VIKLKRKNNMVKTSEIEKFYYFFPQTVALVGVKRNVMPAAWHTPISAKPPLFGVLISPKRYTYSLLEKETGFTINFLEHSQASLMAKTGSTSGKDIDKLKEFKIKFSSADEVGGMILLDSYATYECEKFAMHEYGDHFLVIGKIVLIHYRKGLINPEGIVDEKKVSPMLYFGKDRYITIDPDTLSIHKRK